MKKQHHINISVPVTFLKEGSKFIAYTPALDLSTCGNTFEHAQKRFSEAANMFLQDLMERGTLEEVLLSCGWEKVSKPKPRWIAPQVIGNSTQQVSLAVA